MPVFILSTALLFISIVFQVQAQNWNWAETAGGTLPDEANGCYQDDNGNMYLSGFYFSSDVNFGNGSQLSNDGLSDGFIVKYDANGSTQWSSKVKGPAEDKATKCTADRFGNVFTTGYFDSPSIQFGGNNNDNVTMANPGNGSGAFIMKLDPNLNALWARGFSSDSNDEALGCYADRYGNTVVTGTFSGNSLTIGNNSLNNNGGDEIFLAKYNTQGDLFWATKIGKSDDDGATDCHLADNGRVLISGYYNSGSLTLGNIDLENSYFLVNTSDLFVANMCNAQEGTHVVNACGDYTWIDGNTYSSSSNTAVFSFPNSGGSCDSIVILDLTINSVDVDVIESSPNLTAIAANATYRWLDCDNNYAFIAGETGQIFTATSNGSYAVEVSENACVDTSNCVEVNNVTVEVTEEENSSFQVYPNPSSGELIIEFFKAAPGVLEVYEHTGKLLEEQAFGYQKRLHIDLPEKTGIYLLRIQTVDGLVGFERVLKQ